MTKRKIKVTIKTLNIYNIRIDGNTQSRVAINQEAVSDYADYMSDGDNLPEPIVFFDGAEYWLADGFHRYHATLKIGKASLIVEVRSGTQRDAILYSLSANAGHGLRPNNEDKRKAVGIMLNDPEWAELSDRQIARHCGCSRFLVGKLRTPDAPVKETKPAPSGINATSDTAPEAETSGINATQAPAAAPTPLQQEAAKQAEEAHGGDDDPIKLLEEAHNEINELRTLLSVAETDDAKGEIIKYKRIADTAQRRQNELMDTVNDREKELKRQMNTLRRICTAVGEDDPSKVAAVVEALARKARGG